MNENVIVKIKKLLSLSQSQNENEAKLALLKAQELMLRYDISAEKINENHKSIVIELETKYYFTNYKNTYLAQGIEMISDLYLCKVCACCYGKSSKRYIKIIGRDTDCKILEKVIGFIKSNVDQWTKEIKAEFDINIKTLNAIKNDYGIGFCEGLLELLEKQKETIQQEQGLVLSVPKEAINYISKLNKNCNIGNANFANNNKVLELGYISGYTAEIQNKI